MASAAAMRTAACLLLLSPSWGGTSSTCEAQPADESSLLSTRGYAKRRRQDPAPTSLWPVVQPGPSWNVPRFSLPSCLGILPDFDMQWWYFAGAGTDAHGHSYSLFFHVDRVSIPEMNKTSSGFYFALGRPACSEASKDTFLYAAAVDFGVTDKEEEAGAAATYIPPVTDSSFVIHHKPAALEGAGQGFSYHYDAQASAGKAVGTPGAVYNLRASGVVDTVDLKPASGKVPYAVDLKVQDGRGTVLSGTSNGDAELAMGPRGSWEFALPVLNILEGSINHGGEEIALVGGSIWLDMQTVKKAPDYPLIPDRGIYLGTWSSVILDNGVVLQAWNLWEQQDTAGQQWISGTKVGRPPKNVAGSLYFPLENPKLDLGMNGGAPLWSSDDFDLNILNPEDPASSPHVTSPESNYTYAAAWQLSINLEKLGAYGEGLPSTLYIFPLFKSEGEAVVVPEMHMMGKGTRTYFYELSASVYADRQRMRPVGRAFMEQMGFN